MSGNLLAIVSHEIGSCSDAKPSLEKQIFFLMAHLIPYNVPTRIRVRRERSATFSNPMQHFNRILSQRLSVILSGLCIRILRQ